MVLLNKNHQNVKYAQKYNILVFKLLIYFQIMGILEWVYTRYILYLDVVPLGVPPPTPPHLLERQTTLGWVWGNVVVRSERWVGLKGGCRAALYHIYNMSR